MPNACPTEPPNRRGKNMDRPDYLQLATAQARLLAEQVRPMHDEDTELHEAHVYEWLYTELPEDELARLQEELEAIWAFHDDQPPSSAQHAGHQLRCERLCDRIAALKWRTHG